MTKVKVFSSTELRSGAKLAIRWGLYIPGWMMIRVLEQWAAGITCTPSDRLAICYQKDVPVALCLRTRDDLMIFCKESERRKGYGTRCANAIGNLAPGTRAFIGVDGSEAFWARRGLQATRYEPRARNLES